MAIRRDDPRTTAQKRADAALLRAFERGSLPRASPEDRRRALDRLRERRRRARKAAARMGVGIKAMRLALGMTQDELARSMMTQRSDVSRLETGDYGGMTIERLLLIVDTLAGRSGMNSVTLFDGHQQHRGIPSLSLLAPGALEPESSPCTRKEAI